jgi:hypothetical protein
MKHKTKKGIQSLLLMVIVGIMIYDIDYDKTIYLDFVEIIIVSCLAFYNYFWRKKRG